MQKLKAYPFYQCFFIHDQANNSLKSEFWKSFLSQPPSNEIYWRHLNVNKRGVSELFSKSCDTWSITCIVEVPVEWWWSVVVLIDHDSSISIDTDVCWTPYNLQLTIDRYFSVTSVNNHDSLPTSQPRYWLTCWLFQDIDWPCWPQWSVKMSGNISAEM